MNFIANLLGLGWLWHWITSWWDIMLAYGTAGLIVAGLIAVAFLVPVIGLRLRIACLAAAAIIVGLTISFTVGIKKGADRVKADWDWTLAAEATEGETARTDAERSVPEPSVDGGELRDDPWNRDRWPK